QTCALPIYLHIGPPGTRQSRAPATPGSGTYRPRTTQNGPHPRRTPENADYRPADRTPGQRTSASHPQPDPDTPHTSPAVTRHEEPPEHHHRLIPATPS